MKYFKIALLAAMLLLGANPGNATLTQAQPSTKAADTTSEDINVLAQGSHSEVAKPFLAVAREPQVYAQLRKLEPSLPSLTEEFFKERLVVAAFMGDRNTAGYSVEITRASNGAIWVAANGPGKGSMVAQVITAPFKVVSVPRQPWSGLDAEGIWQAAADHYRVTRGDFTVSGGLMGRREDFGVVGQIRVLRVGKLATFLLDLKNSDGVKQRSLKDSATGFEEEGRITIQLMDSGSLIEMPHGDLSATGKFSGNSKRLAIRFTSLPTMFIADGYGGGGSVEAEAAAPIPMNRLAADKN
jgi:PrcB C-terminal